jgi:hypothetical protein
VWALGEKSLCGRSPQPYCFLHNKEFNNFHFLNIVKVSRRIGLGLNMKGDEEVCSKLFRKLEAGRPRGRPKRVWKDNDTRKKGPEEYVSSLYSGWNALVVAK